MRLSRFALLGIGLAAMAACSSDTGSTTTPIGPLTYVRYVQAMPDTGEVDVHVVDKVENLNFADPGTGYTPYQWVSPYQGIAAGSRHFRVFSDMRSNDINVVSQVILDTTITLAANTYYTILHTGYARAGSTPKQHFVVLQDAVPTPSSAQVAIRAVVAAPGIGPVDVYTPSDTGAATPSSAAISSVTYGTPSTWVNFATGKFALRVFASGTTTPMLTQALAPAGAPQQTYLDPVAGTTQGGTALSAFVFPAGIGTQAGKAAKVVYSVDRRPPRQ